MLQDPSGNSPSLSQVITGVAIVAAGAVVVVAVVATAGAAGAAVGAAAAMYLGASSATAATVATVATVGAYGVAAGVGATTLSNAGETLTGTNIIRDKVMGGNQSAYDTLQIALSVGAGGIITVGSNNLSTNSTKGTSSTIKDTKNDSSNKYYQVTSKEAAQSIAKDGKLIPSSSEKTVCVLKNQPTIKQASALGAKSAQTVISFNTNSTTWLPDKTVSIVNDALRNMINGPINVTNVQEVGFKK